MCEDKPVITEEVFNKFVQKAKDERRQLLEQERERKLKMVSGHALFWEFVCSMRYECHFAAGMNSLGAQKSTLLDPEK